MTKSDFLHIVKERGFLHQCTDLEGLDKLLHAQKLHAQKPVTGYSGFDCTAPSLHVGSLMQIMLLRWFQKCGHKPIVLMGGGTTKIGDPSGKDKSREILSDDVILKNMEAIKANFKPFIAFGTGATDALLLNNDQWLSRLDVYTYLRDYGAHLSMSYMLNKESVKLRLQREQHMSFLEFNYMLLQAYDFLELSNRDCRLQFGGSDQWGNITSGIELYRRIKSKDDPASRIKIYNTEGEKKEFHIEGYNDLFGLTTPLLTTTSGAKMGKTENGAVWLNANMCSPFEYWQFWRNTEDADVGRFLRFFTELPIPEIGKLEQLQGAEINEAKKILANEATTLCHGEEAARMAAETARKTFEEGGAGENLKTYYVEESLLQSGIPASKLFFEAGLADSGTEARKLIEGGGGRVNDEKVLDAKTMISVKNLGSNGYIKLSAGKKNHVLVKIKR